MKKKRKMATNFQQVARSEELEALKKEAHVKDAENDNGGVQASQYAVFKEIVGSKIGRLRAPAVVGGKALVTSVEGAQDAKESAEERVDQMTKVAVFGVKMLGDGARFHEVSAVRGTASPIAGDACVLNCEVTVACGDEAEAERGVSLALTMDEAVFGVRRVCLAFVPGAEARPVICGGAASGTAIRVVSSAVELTCGGYQRRRPQKRVALVSALTWVDYQVVRGGSVVMGNDALSLDPGRADFQLGSQETTAPVGTGDGGLLRSEVGQVPWGRVLGASAAAGPRGVIGRALCSVMATFRLFALTAVSAATVSVSAPSLTAHFGVVFFLTNSFSDVWWCAAKATRYWRLEVIGWWR